MKDGTAGNRNPEDEKSSKAGEERDDVPHGQGAHHNEKESNAQEDYPGTQNEDEDKDPAGE